MFHAIIPELMTLSVFILSLLCILAGKSPGYLQNYEVLYMNVTGLKASYHAKTSEVLPVHDFYKVHLTTHCQGYYQDGLNPPLVNVSCSPVSSYTKFLPSTLIASDLAASSANATLQSLSFPVVIQDYFTSAYNLQIHVSYVFYILSLIFTGIALVLGLLAFTVGELGTAICTLTSLVSTFLLISSAIITAVQSQATKTINLFGQGLENGAWLGEGIVGGYGKGLLVLSWTAFGLNILSSLVWSLEGKLSWGFGSL